MSSPAFPPRGSGGHGPFRSSQIRPGDGYELSNGHPIECLPTGGEGATKTKLGAMVILTDPDALSGGIDPGYSPNRGMLRAPDLAVGNVPDEPGWIQGVPLLAVEYAGTGQDEKDLQTKIKEPLKEGTRLVWVVRLTGVPRVEVHEKDRPVRTAGLDDELSAPGILRNAVPIRALFDEEAARRVNLRNLLQRFGYDGIDAIRAEGKAEGKIEGEAKSSARAVVAFLAARGFALSDGERERILACTDRTLLDSWITRSATITDLARLFD